MNKTKKSSPGRKKVDYSAGLYFRKIRKGKAKFHKVRSVPLKNRKQLINKDFNCKELLNEMIKSHVTRIELGKWLKIREMQNHDEENFKMVTTSDFSPLVFKKLRPNVEIPD